MKIMNQKSLSVSRLFTSAMLMLLISACSSLSSQPENIDITAPATKSSNSYAEKAVSSEMPIKTDWQIMTLKAYVEEENINQANALISTLKKQNLSQIQLAEVVMANAQMIKLSSGTEMAIKSLIFNQSWNLKEVQWVNYYLLKAEYSEEINDYFNADRALIAVKQYPQQVDTADIDNRIWDNLMNYSPEEIIGVRAFESEKELQGWIYVATGMKTKLDTPMEWQEELQNWFDMNITHPIITNTPENVQQLLDLDIKAPTNVALLLPLNGKYEKPATLIRDGFIHAMSNDLDKDPDFKMTIYDTSTESLESIHEKLKLEQTDFIVGPLIKENIANMQSIVGDSIPMLALNFPDNKEESDQVCYLTLSPEQEGSQAAKYLFNSGYQYPLIIAQKDSLGERITEAFVTEWQKLSDNPVAKGQFGNRAELQKDVNKSLGLAESQNRINKIIQITNMNLETEARSRRDIDAIYMPASRSDLTLMKPFIEVAINPGAEQPKLFTNSQSNNGKARQYQDVSGITYSDIPMLINNTAEGQEFDSLWPNSSNTEKRLHALGMDAYHLLNELPTMKAVPHYQTPGQTGLLSINDECIVQRELSWAEHESFEPKE